MNNYGPAFISFAAERMRTQGEVIIAWSKTDNPLLAQTCREIIEAAQFVETKESSVDGNGCAMSSQKYAEANFQESLRNTKEAGAGK